MFFTVFIMLLILILKYFLIVFPCVAGGTDNIEIIIKEGTTGIDSGDSYDLGNVDAGTSGSVITFTIKNSGTADLNLTGLPDAAVISGADAGEFVVAQPLTTTITGGSNTTFTIQFNPAGTGVKTAAITIEHNDSDQGTYIFDITGTGTTPPFIDNGDSTVTDNEGVGAGLMWQKGNGTAPSIALSDMQSYCSSLTLAGYNDWRVPTIIELGYIMPDGAPYFTTDAFKYLVSSDACFDSFYGAGLWHRRMYLGSTVCYAFDWTPNSFELRCVR